MHLPRTFGLALAALASVCVLVAPAAFATNPEPMKLEFSGAFTDPDFCGSGAEVAVDSSFHGTLFNAPNQAGLEFWLTLQAEDVFTNVLTGQRATVRSAGTQRWSFVHDGDPATPPLSVTLDTGLRSQLVLPGGGGLHTRDAGYVVLTFTFTIFDGEILVEHGPHPSLAGLLAAGSDTFCTTMTEVLGLT
jgi:hypothetical protein